MDIECTKDDTTLTVSLSGDLDTNTAPSLTATLDEKLAGITALIIDMTGVGYLSSAGIRAILLSNAAMSAVSGTLNLVGVQPAVYKVLEITCLTDSLDVARA